MARETDLIIRLREDITKLQSDQKKAMASMRKHKSELSVLGKQISKSIVNAFGAYAIFEGLKRSTNAWDKQAKAVAQVKQGIITTGSAAGKTLGELTKQASDLQSKTLFGDEEILANATAQLLTFTNIAGDQFDKTQKAALNLATRLDGDLKSASIQLGKALNDPVANLSALSRSGIQFSESQKTLINSLAETNRLSEAQDLILAELEKQYGGSAEAAAQAGTGGFKQLANDLGDLTEQIGRLLTENSGTKGLIGWFREVVKNTTNVLSDIGKGTLGTILEDLQTKLDLLGNSQGSLDTISVLMANMKTRLSGLNSELKELELSDKTIFNDGKIDAVNSAIKLLTPQIELYKKKQEEVTRALEAQVEQTKILEKEQQKLVAHKSIGLGLKNVSGKNEAPAIIGAEQLDPSFLVIDTDEAIKQNQVNFAKWRAGIKTDIDLLNEQINGSLNQSLSDAIVGLASVIGSGGGIDDALGGLMAIIAKGMQEIGAAMIAFGLAEAGFQAAIESLNPYVAIAAGVALVAAGAALSNARGSFSRSHSGGSRGQGVSGSFQGSNTGQSIKVEGDFEIEGTKLKLVLANQNRFDSRNQL